MPKLTFPTEQMDEVWPGTTVTLRDIAKSSNLFPVKAALNKQYGFDEWGPEQVAKYLQAGRLAKASQGKSHQRGKKIDVERIAPLENADFKSRLEALMSPFDKDTITPNDYISFRNLAEIQMQMDALTEQLRSGEYRSDVSKLKTLNETYAKLSGEARQLQSALGIDRSSRETQVDTGAAIRHMVQGAQETLRANAVMIVCPACKARDVLINQGYILFHFRQDVPWKWESVCPKCGGPVRFEGKGNDHGSSGLANSSASGQEEAETVALRLAPSPDDEPAGHKELGGGVQ